MRKAYEVRHVMNLRPFEGLVLFVFFGQELDRGGIGPGEFVTTHTGIHRRNPCNRRATRSGMAVLTLHFHLTGMQRVIEREYLIRLIPDIIH